MELFEPVEGAFDEGGLMDEGGSVDPVSGNDVPVGSTKEEVRDDIPAQLSEGEFVLPADVVRFHGLEKIMALRDEAKAGLARMEAMGQMGNSEEAIIPDGVPFDINDLDMEDDGVVEYAQGGVVHAQAGTFVQPQGFTGISGTQQSQFAGYQPQYTAYTPPPIPGGQQLAQQYTPAAQQFTPTINQQAPTFTGMTGVAAPSTGGYDELKTYVNDAGMEMQIPFKDGKPIYPIPEGYKAKTEAVQTAQTQTTTGTGVGTTGVIDNTGDGTSGDGPQYSTTDVTGLGYDRSKIEHEGIKDILNSVARNQITDFSPQGATYREFGLTDIGKTGTASQFKGVMDNFRGIDAQGKYSDTRALHDFNVADYDEIVSRYNQVQSQMKDIYGSTKPNGEFEYKSMDEIRSGLVAKAKELGIDPNRKGSNISKHQRTLEKEIASELDRRNQQAKDSKGTDSRTEQALEAAAKRAADSLPPGYKIDTSKYDNLPPAERAREIRKEVSQQQTKKKEDDARREREEAAQRAEAARSSGGGWDYDSGPDPFGGTGTSSGTDFGGTGYETSTGEAMVAEGGLMNKSKLAKQMEKSGLSPKK